MCRTTYGFLLLTESSIQDLLAIGEMLRIPECIGSSLEMSHSMSKSRTQEVVRSIRKMFGDRIIRRDLFSVGPDGVRISDLKPYKIIVHHLNAKEWEADKIARALEMDMRRNQTHSAGAVGTSVSRHTNGKSPH
jgi:hypothetical protein